MSTPAGEFPCGPASNARQSAGAYLFGAESAIAQSADAERIVALGEADAGVIAHQIAVIEAGSFPAQSSIEEELARGRLQQIGSAHHLRNSHRVVVRNTGELVSGNVVSAPDYKIPKIGAAAVELRPAVEGGESDLPAVRNAK